MREEDRDISLYDQLKLTAALAACVSEYLQQADAFSLLDTPAELRREPAFLLYTADFSRIQRFIYTVHTEGALRSLRSRSFFLELLMEHYMDELLDGCGLTRTNIIYSGGGHCYLLLPNTAAVQQTLADWNRAFNGWLNEQFGVQLFLANGWTPCSANDLCNVPAEASPYKALFRRVNAIAEQHKQHPYDAAALRALNRVQAIPDGTRECKVCGNSAQVNAEGLCPWCNRFANLSAQIQNQSIYLVHSTPRPGAFALPGIRGSKRFLSFSNDSALCADTVRSYTKNRLVRTLSPSINLFVGDYAASNRIEDLADQSEGIRRVAICRMDVDNLGQAFLAGFEQPDQTDPVQRMKYVNLFRAAAEQTAALEDEAKKLPDKNGAALFDAAPDHTYSWDVLRDKVLGEKIPCLEQFFAQFQKKDDDHRGNSMLYNLTDLLRNTREDQVNFARCVYLLARRSCINGETLPDFSADGEVILRMFGGSEPVRFARLQFADAFLLNSDQLKGVGVTEVKSENTINRLTSKATPRQIERVVAGCRFGVNIVYNLSDPKEMEEDLSLLSKAMKLLQLDYLGGIGGRTSAGYGRFHLDSEPICLNTAEDASLRWMLQALERCTTLELHGAPLQMEPLGSHSVENGLQLLLAAREELASRTRLWFRTPCAFKQAGRYAIYPQEFLLLQSLVLHWNTAFPDCQLNDPDALDAILRGLHILDYNLHTVSYPIKNTRIPGFVGSAVVEARLALPLLELWNALLSFAPYGGIGIKTTLGMGGVSVEPLAPPQRSL